MKFLFKTTLILLILVSGLLSCSEEKREKIELNALIAPDAVMHIHFKDFKKWRENLNNQSFLSKQKTLPFQEALSVKTFEEVINIPEEIFLSLNLLGKNEPIKTLVFQQKENDSLKLEAKSKYDYDGFTIQEIATKDQPVFSASVENFQILSDSKIILENIIRNYTNQIKPKEDIIKLFDGLSAGSPSVVIHTKLFSKLSTNYFTSPFPEQYLSLSDYLGFDIKIDTEKILFSGITFHAKKNNDWHKFKNVKPDESLAAEVIPSSFVHAKSIICSDYYQLYPNNLATENPKQKDSLLLDIKEVFEIEFANAHSKVFHSKNIEQSFEKLEDISKPFSEFSAVKIHEFTDSKILSELFYPFLKKQSLKYFFIYNDFIVSSEKTETLENIIIQINNENVLAKDPNFKNHIEDLYSKSHILWFTNMKQQSDFFEKNITSEYRRDFKKTDWKAHDFIVSQLIAEDNFAYLNILQRKQAPIKSKASVNQQIRIKHDNDIISKPQFFKNWRTGQYDIVFQDTQNILYLKDTKDNLIWSKKLDSRIIGDIFTIDIYKNKRLQLAFATKNKIYIIDKNGNDVSPFPLDNKDEVTQSLSVFDYDKNGEYRFVVVMDDKVRMYDKEAKRVRGFKFRRSKDPVAYPVKHMRMGSKDYIVVQEKSGLLNILNRRGKERIALPKDFRHTENEWYEHDDKFVSVNDKGNILEIDQSGNIKTIKKDWLNPKFDASAKHFAEMSENELIINNNTVELPFGLYTNPRIMDKHVGIADIQAQKIYVSDFDGNMVDGFPTFGKVINDYYYSGDYLYLLCQDEDHAMLVYKTRYK